MLQWHYIEGGSSLGNVVPDAALHAVLGPGQIGGGVDYRALAVYNPSPSLTVSTLRVWTSLGDGGGAIAIGLSPRGVQSGSSALVGAGEPGSVTFSTPTTRASGLAVTSLPPLSAFVVWIRRTLTTGTPASPELNRLHVAGTSPL